MDASEEWKSLWPISLVHAPPLLLSPTTTPDAIETVGPLIFNPSTEPQTSYHLFTSHSNSPQIPPPFPSISFRRFLRTSSSVLPSTTTSISSDVSSSLINSDPILAHNSLQLMRCPGTDSTLAFFPTGPNSDQVGFVVLSVENSRLKVRGDCIVTEALTSTDSLSHRIMKISVSQVADCECTSVDSTIGYLLVNTAYSVHYYNIRIRMKSSGRLVPRLELVGIKLSKSSAVVNACWSPHIPEQSLVLLDNGDLYLFDLDGCSDPLISSPKVMGEKLDVSWGESVAYENGEWLSCDFSWHIRILIVVHSTVVFLVELQSEKSNVTPLLKVGSEHLPNDKFIAFSIVAHDRFYFTLASKHMLFLCDLRKPMIPVIRWAHNVANPSNMIVYSLSDLRSQSDDDTYNWASEEGYGILLGTFWNSEFSLFCYGPDVRESSSSRVSGSSKSFCAWGLPSSLSMVTNECRCGSCIVKEEFCKDKLPNWINWQQKKEIVLGFGILDKEICSKLFKSVGSGGFTLVTLTSSGNIRSHRYCASWDSSQTSGKSHSNQGLDSEDSYETGEEEYKFKKVFEYFKFNWLDRYLKSDLARALSIELAKDIDNGRHKKASFGQDFHEIICQKINTLGSLDIHGVFKDISLPTSIHEIALRSLWTNLPTEVLRLGFSPYSDLRNVNGKVMNTPFEFLEVPCEQSHLPPFLLRSPSSRSSKWSEKQQPSNSLVGPVIPIPFLMTFHKTRMLKADNISADSEIDLECDEVMKIANEVTSLDSCNDHIVSLDADNENVSHSSQNPPQFASYKPVAFSGKSLVNDKTMEDSDFEDMKHTNLVFRVGQKNAEEVFGSHCLLKFKPDEKTREFGPKEMKSYKLLKRQFSNFKEGFSSYQEYKTKTNIHKS